MKLNHGIRYLITIGAVIFLCSCAASSDPTGTDVVPDTSSESVETTTTTVAPTATPTPTLTPTPTPVPTPVPEYVEPLFEETWINGYVDPRSVAAVIVTNPDDIDVLVNKYYTLPSDYEPEDLVDAPYSMNQQLRSEACEAWVQMHDACLEETGCELVLMSGYRSFSLQEYLFTRAIGRSISVAVMKNAYQGRSEHQLGLAIDLVRPGDTQLSDSFDETTQGAWVNEHCYEYGFIRRYTEDFTSETGYADEAWHYRYVGIELATYLTENNISLEAYYGVCQVVPGDE